MAANIPEAPPPITPIRRMLLLLSGTGARIEETERATIAAATAKDLQQQRHGNKRRWTTIV